MAGSKAILVPLDGSPLSERVLPYALTLARSLGQGIRVVRVCETPRARQAWLDSSEREEAERYVDTIAERLRPRVSQVSTLVDHGRPADQILVAARKRDIVMVTMATNGRGGLERLLIGSVADEVMRRCAKPTLLCVPSDFCGTPPAVELQRLVVPLDGTHSSEAALPLAVELAQASGATLALVQVLAPSSRENADDPSLAERAAAAKTHLESVATRVPPQIHCEIAVLRAVNPAEALALFAETTDTDLVVMNSRGLGGLKRLTHRSTADSLVRAAVPVLVRHPRQRQSTKPSQQAPVAERSA
jgi:nucleotide-binding universal stress UspA family protein